MAKRISLHEFQAGLARRLADARDTRASALLAVQVGQRNWLIDLTEAGEILAVPPSRRSPRRAVVPRPGQRARQPVRRGRFRILPRRRADPPWGTPACC
jgi:twitching motility protein PilI